MYSIIDGHYSLSVSNRTRIVILGKTGSGKSSLANTIFGDELFKIGHTANSETSKCGAITKSVNGRNITLIDTPGFFDTDRSEEELKPGIVRCITECAPGPHAFLIVLKVERFTEQEQAVIAKINHYFSEEVLKYSTVLFTHGDQLEEGQTIEDFVRGNELLSDLVKKCGGRCHVVDNKYWKNNQQDEYRNNQFQVKELLKTMDKITEANRGSYYTNEVLQAVEEEIKQEEELIRQSLGNMSEIEIREKANDRVYDRLLISVAAFTAVPNTLRIVLLGKTGVGKSSLANNIFGEAIFKINNFNDLERHCTTPETKYANGRSITLIDTPGFFDQGRSEEKMKPEIVRCITECAPGPHAFLIVLKVEKFTEHEKAVITQMCEDFSENALNYAVIVFTHGDQLPEGMKMEEYVEESKGLSDLLKKCGGRCHVVDNKYWKNSQEVYRSNQFQVAELLNTIDKMVRENNGGFYTDEKLKEVERKILEEEELIRRSSGNMSQEETRKQAKSNVFKKQVDDAAPTRRRVLMKFAVIAGLFAIVSALLINSKFVKVLKKWWLSNRTRIVILGKTGSGKSSLANTIFGDELFKIGRTANSETSKCRAITKSVNGRNITLIDTPGFFDTDRSEEELKSEIVRCITECAPGPHAFLIVLKVERFTEQEQAVIAKINHYFSEEVYKYATVLFTYGDLLPEGQTIEDFVRGNELLSDLVKKCGGRCHVVDNKYWKNNQQDEYRNNQFQVKELLKTMDKITEANKGSRYTRQTIEDFVRGNELLSDLVKKCGGRCHVVDNKHWKNNQQDEYRNNQFQVKELLKTMDKITEANKGSCYTNEMLQAEAEGAVEAEAGAETLAKTPNPKSSCAISVADLDMGQTIEDFVRGNELLSDLVKKCGGRCHVVDNKYWKNNQQDEYRNNQFQVKELLKTIEKISEANGGSYYTNEMLQAVEEEIKQEVELIRKSPGNMSEEEIREKAKDRV
ncbi:uncharacterized protein LOC129116239, partial [Anoplopoma fimbria]|uniref:uncharacterized protein LOC129116239 n=1 Tax=Anoplopoma fimbria TaxID=229290 RepID=UPI0023EC9728